MREKETIEKSAHLCFSNPRKRTF